MTEDMTRRDFLHLAASGVAVAGLGGEGFGHEPIDSPQFGPLRGLPKLDGPIDYELTILERAAVDQGGIVRQLPRALHTPKSVGDVARLVQYAHEKTLPIAMRGRGHSAYGQTLVERGVVIDSSSLDKVVGISGNTIEVEAGASLGTVVRAAFEAGLAAPVMSGCSMLSVGGWISVGGVGGASFQHGAFIDHVIELQVVTGDGQVITCSAGREPELFSMMLGGMGQCGLIVRAKLQLMAAPGQFTSRTIDYDSLEAFLGDQEKFVDMDELHSLWTAISPRSDGSWRYQVTVGRRGAVDEDTDPLPLLGNVSRGRVGRAVRRLYRDMVPPPSVAPASLRQLNPVTDVAPGRRIVGRPAMCVYVPASRARELMAPILASPADSAGISAIECVAFNSQRFRRPLFRLPSESRVFSCWALRTAYSDSAPDLPRQLELNSTFLKRALDVGAVRYPPFGGMTTPSDWRAHYGDSLYGRFAAAKRRYDPRGILTPGAGIFPRVDAGQRSGAR